MVFDTCYMNFKELTKNMQFIVPLHKCFWNSTRWTCWARAAGQPVIILLQIKPIPSFSNPQTTHTHTHTHNLPSSSKTQPPPERTLMRAGVASIQSSSIHHCTIIPEQSSAHNYCLVSLHRTLPCNAHMQMQMHAAIPPPPLYERSKTHSHCPWSTIM